MSTIVLTPQALTYSAASVQFSYIPGFFSVPEKPLLHATKEVLGIIAGGKTSFSGTLKSPADTVDHALDCLCKLVDIFHRVLPRVRKLGLEGNEALMSAYERCLDLIVSLVLLNARIRKRLPAREGILLAREHKALIST